MSNNAPDYEDNLVFPPKEIKSQHELSEQGRQSEVLITAIERCEKLEKEIIALNKEYNAECHRADELEDSLHISWQNESKLKELLKECHSGFRKLPIYNLVGEDEAREVNKLLNKIDNAIGE